MMNITLLAAQAALADTLAGGNPVLTPVSEEARMNLWDMAMKGGWIMLVLALLSVVCFYIFFERMAVIRKAGKDDPLFMERIRDYIRTGEIKSAINYCRITNTPSARMIEKGITRMGTSCCRCAGCYRKFRQYRSGKTGERTACCGDYCRRCSDDWFPWYCNRYGAGFLGNVQCREQH